MTSKNLEIKTATIDIHVVRVDGHKMTKATFRQIPVTRLEAEEFPPDNQILGWVLDDATEFYYEFNKSKQRTARHPWLLFKHKEKLVRMDVAGWTRGGSPLSEFYCQIYIAT
jgi:hypothetical protein